MSIEDRLFQRVRNVSDFPKQGIQFKDISPVLSDPVLCRDLAEAMAKPFMNKKIDCVAGIESRGFLFGMMIAQRLNCGFTIIRKEGKLPSQTIAQEYALEYGHATIEMQVDAVKTGQNVLIHDDLLATGGTAAATAMLIQNAGGNIAGFNFLLELEFLSGKLALQPYHENVVSILKY